MVYACPMFAGDAVFPNEVHCGTRCPMFVGDAVFPGEIHWGTDAQCLRGMPYSLVKFTGAPDAQCLRGMPYSLVKFTGAPDAQCLQGMPYSQVMFTGVPDAQCLWRIWMPSPTNYPASWYAVYYVYSNPYSRIPSPYNYSEMYHYGFTLLQAVLIMVCCVYCMVGVNITLQKGVLTVATN